MAHPGNLVVVASRKRNLAQFYPRLCYMNGGRGGKTLIRSLVLGARIIVPLPQEELLSEAAIPSKVG